ncbi:MAG: phosphotransferase [Gammaproteobacteria bacterium]|nr:phosphotransferase [Gammaproteobacteria bacterium]
MSNFYSLDDAGKTPSFQRLVEQALPLWGMSGARAAIIKQRENAVFSLQCADGTRAVMRIHRTGYHSNAELHSELQWMKALDAFGVHTPAVIPALDGELFKTVSVPAVPEPRQVDVLAWVDGKDIGSIEAGLGDLAAARKNYRLIGQLVAGMHDFSSRWELPPGFSRHAWDEAGLLGERPWWGRFWELELLDDARRARLLAAREKARTELRAYGRGKDRYGLIHADTLPENFLVDADGTVRVIDFDDGGFGWHLFDFATALFFVSGEEHFNELLEAMASGYQQVRALPPEFERRLPLFLLMRGFAYLGWIHTRSETDTARTLGPVVLEGVMKMVEEFLAVIPHDGGDGG